MAAFKNKDNGTWYVQFRYTDWKGERQQKLKRGFATKREALEWEREFLMEKQADVNMTFESFVALYEKDIKPCLLYTSPGHFRRRAGEFQPELFLPRLWDQHRGGGAQELFLQ